MQQPHTNDEANARTCVRKPSRTNEMNGIGCTRARFCFMAGSRRKVNDKAGQVGINAKANTVAKYVGRRQGNTTPRLLSIMITFLVHLSTPVYRILCHEATGPVCHSLPAHGARAHSHYYRSPLCHHTSYTSHDIYVFLHVAPCMRNHEIPLTPCGRLSRVAEGLYPSGVLIVVKPHHA